MSYVEECGNPAQTRTESDEDHSPKRLTSKKTSEKQATILRPIEVMKEEESRRNTRITLERGNRTDFTGELGVGI